MIEEKRRTTALMNLTRTLQLEDESLIDSNYQEQFKRLTAFIEDLINNNFDKLVHILYRIDVSENKLRSVLAKSSGSESSNLIAQLIIEREMEKIATREKYSKR